MAWDVEECEDAKLAGELVSMVCLKEQISRCLKQPLVLNANNGNALAAGFRAAIASSHSGNSIRGTGRAPVVLQPKGVERQPVLRISVQDSEIPA